MMKTEKNSGFTLIEITVVISLISIMFFFAVPRFRNAVLTDSVNDTSRWIIGKVRVLKEYSTTKQKLTILLVTHDLNVVWEYGTQVLCLNRKQMCMGKPDEVLTPEQLKQLYGTGIKFYKHQHR